MGFITLVSRPSSQRWNALSEVFQDQTGLSKWLWDIYHGNLLDKWISTWHWTKWTSRLSAKISFIAGGSDILSGQGRSLSISPSLSQRGPLAFTTCSFQMYTRVEHKGEREAFWCLKRQAEIWRYYKARLADWSLGGQLRLALIWTHSSRVYLYSLKHVSTMLQTSFPQMLSLPQPALPAARRLAQPKGLWAGGCQRQVITEHQRSGTKKLPYWDAAQHHSWRTDFPGLLRFLIYISFCGYHLYSILSPESWLRRHF